MKSPKDTRRRKIYIRAFPSKNWIPNVFSSHNQLPDSGERGFDERLTLKEDQRKQVVWYYSGRWEFVLENIASVFLQRANESYITIKGSKRVGYMVKWPSSFQSATWSVAMQTALHSSTEVVLIYIKFYNFWWIWIYFSVFLRSFVCKLTQLFKNQAEWKVMWLANLHMKRERITFIAF